MSDEVPFSGKIKDNNLHEDGGSKNIISRV